MKRRLLLSYQLFTGLSDASTGVLLIFEPALTLRLMRLRVPPPDTFAFLSFVGAFVLSVGIACLYGAILAMHPASTSKLEVVWLLTAITRGLVAAFILAEILLGSLETGWVIVAIADGVFALLQGIGLTKGWLNDATA
jgi:hypothetical protein